MFYQHGHPKLRWINFFSWNCYVPLLSYDLLGKIQLRSCNKSMVMCYLGTYITDNLILTISSIWPPKVIILYKILWKCYVPLQSYDLLGKMLCEYRVHYLPVHCIYALSGITLYWNMVFPPKFAKWHIFWWPFRIFTHIEVYWGYTICTSPQVKPHHRMLHTLHIYMYKGTKCRYCSEIRCIVVCCAQGIC